MVDQIDRQVCDILIKNGTLSPGRVNKIFSDLDRLRLAEPALTIQDFLSRLGYKPPHLDNDDLTFKWEKRGADAGDAAHRSAAKAGKPLGKLTHFTGKGAWEVVDIPSNGLTVGRADTCGLRVEDPLASKEHARFIPKGDALFVRDLQSSNGVHLNGLRIATGSMVQVRAGDFVRLGGTLFLMRKAAATPAAGPLSEEDAPRVEIDGPHMDTRARFLRKTPLVVGSANDVDIRLTGPDVSPYHVCLIRHGDKLLAQDLHSAAGTRYTGQRVKRAVLSPGEGIRVGRFVLTFRLGLQGQGGQPSPPTRHGLHTAPPKRAPIPRPPVASQAKRERSETTLAPPLGPYRLKFARGPLRGKSLTIGRRPVTIGRSQEAALTILDDKLSRKHLVLRIEGETLAFRDLESRNGVFLNGKKMESGDLRHGDRIAFGASIALVERREHG